VQCGEALKHIQTVRIHQGPRAA